MQPQDLVNKVVPMPNSPTWLKDTFALIAQPEPLSTNWNKCYYFKSHWCAFRKKEAAHLSTERKWVLQKWIQRFTNPSPCLWTPQMGRYIQLWSCSTNYSINSYEEFRVANLTEWGRRDAVSNVAVKGLNEGHNCPVFHLLSDQSHMDWSVTWLLLTW